MGYGDEIIATGLAQGLRARGKRAAFGDGKRIIWGPWCKAIFQDNPNIAGLGSEGSPDLEWIDHYKGHRKYNHLDKQRSRWVWHYDFRVQPGEIFFDAQELALARSLDPDFIFIEPNVPWHKSVAVNKDWGLKNYQAVADRLLRDGYKVVQTEHGRDKLKGVCRTQTPRFRDALVVLSQATTALVPEGGLHHGAAAVGTPAVVIFGGFIPPAIMGYEGHVNFTGGVEEACGSLGTCMHCRSAMNNISVEEVYEAIKKFL